MRRRLVVLACAGLVAVAGCGGDGSARPPAAVRSALSQVDHAVAAHDAAAARRALDVLVRRTVAAREAGELSQQRADRVLAAAARLALALPQPTPSPRPTPAPTATGGHGKGEGKKGEDRKKGEGGD